jgi:hypothetical protein
VSCGIIGAEEQIEYNRCFMIKSYRLCTFVFFFVSFLFSGGPSGSVTAQTANSPVVSTNDDEYTVIASIINDRYADTKRPIIVEEFLAPCTVSSTFLRDTENTIDSLRLATMHNECFLKSKELINPKRIKNSRQLTPIKEGQYTKFFEGGDCEIGWKAFYKKYPRSQGYVKFSRVGFDERKEFAILEFTYVKQCLDGEGHLFILKRVDGKWQVAIDAPLWMF